MLQRSRVVFRDVGRVFGIAIGGLLLAAAASGCKQRKATEADCQLIIDRLVEAELKSMNNTDPIAIAKKQETIRAAMKEEVKDCTGRQVSDAIMSCVKTADTADAIQKCIR